MTCSIMSEGLAPREFFSKNVYARKPRKCIECNCEIAVGEKYESATGVWGNKTDHYCTCLPCVEVREEFFDDFCYGQIWEDLANGCTEEEITIDQLDRLSPAAVAKIEEQLEEDWRLRLEEES